MIDYALYDQNKTEYNIKNSLKPIEFIIYKEVDNTISSYQTSNATILNITMSQTRFINYTFNLTTNASIHFQLKPIDFSLKVGYLVVLRYGDLPNIQNGFYDLWKLFCPNGK
jgi:hypothetical protein